MKMCPNCHSQINDDAAFCPVCGTAVDAVPVLPPRPDTGYAIPQNYAPPAPVFDPYDHTKEFESEDIGANKLFCMLAYLLDFIGVIIALLAVRDSAYVQFHIRQSLKYTVVEVLLSVVVVLLCWTFIVPFLGIVAYLILLVLKFISFVQVCAGQAKEPTIIRSLKFLQ